MNRMHRKLCSSPEWAKSVAARLPQVTDKVDLGAEVLEIGPGYGATTRVLAARIANLTALEVDEASAMRLAGELTGDVRVVHGDGARMPFHDNDFSGVVCFTMLHHVPTEQAQDDLFGEAYRVLAPGGVFAGSDSQLNFRFRMLHIGDTMNIIDATTLSDRLAAAGFADIEIEHEPKRIVRFWARKAAS